MTTHRRIPFAAVTTLLCLILPQILLAQKTIYHSEYPSGYSLPAIMAALMREPDFLEVPLVLSKDGVPMVYKDLLLQSATNVVRIFPGRAREDGNFYPADFTADELSQLSYSGDGGPFAALGANMARFADVHSLAKLTAEEFGTAARLLPVIKYPWFHRNEGMDISTTVLEALLAQADSADSRLVCMCYDPDETKRIHEEILPGLPVAVRLVQAVDAQGGSETMRRDREGWIPYKYDWLFTRLGLRVVSAYADALWIDGDIDLTEGELQQFISDSQSLKMDIYLQLDVSRDRNQKDQLTAILETLAPDGLALADPSLLHIHRQQGQTEGQETATGEREQEDGDGARGLLSDPQSLRERLEQLQ